MTAEKISQQPLGVPEFEDLVAAFGCEAVHQPVTLLCRSAAAGSPAASEGSCRCGVLGSEPVDRYPAEPNHERRSI